MAVLPAFPGFWPCRWSNKGVAGNIDVGRGNSGHPAVTMDVKMEIVTF